MKYMQSSSRHLTTSAQWLLACCTTSADDSGPTHSLETGVRFEESEYFTIANIIYFM